MTLRDVSEKYYLVGCDTMQTSVHGYTRHNAMLLCFPVHPDSHATYLLCPLQFCIPKTYCRVFWNKLGHLATCSTTHVVFPHSTASWFIHHNNLLLTLCHFRQPFAASSIIFPNNVFSIYFETGYIWQQWSYFANMSQLTDIYLKNF